MSDEKHQVTISETSACICIRGSNRVAGTPIHILMSCVALSVARGHHIVFISIRVRVVNSQFIGTRQPVI